MRTNKYRPNVGRGLVGREDDKCTTDIRDTLGQGHLSVITDLPLYQKLYLAGVVYEID